MVKIHKTISMEAETYEHIKKQFNNFSFDFSEWVEKQYRKCFMDIELKQKQIDEYNSKIEILKNDIKEINERKEVFSSGFTNNEKRFLTDIPRLINEGKEWKPLCNLFNNNFNRGLSIEEFKMGVDFFSKVGENK